MGVALPKKWSGQNLTGLTIDYGKAKLHVSNGCKKIIHNDTVLLKSCQQSVEHAFAKQIVLNIKYLPIVVISIETLICYDRKL